jgi:hypothetical protein
MDYLEFMTQYDRLAEIVQKRVEAQQAKDGKVSIQNLFG